MYVEFGPCNVTGTNIRCNIMPNIIPRIIESRWFNILIITKNKKSYTNLSKKCQ